MDLADYVLLSLTEATHWTRIGGVVRPLARRDRP